MVGLIGHWRSHSGDALFSSPLPQHHVSVLQLRVQQNSERTASRTVHMVEEEQALSCLRTTEGAGQEAGTMTWQHQGGLNVQIMTWKITEMEMWLKHKGVLTAQWTHTHTNCNHVCSSGQWERRGTNPLQWCGLLSVRCRRLASVLGSEPSLRHHAFFPEWIHKVHSQSRSVVEPTEENLEHNTWLHYIFVLTLTHQFCSITPGLFLTYHNNMRKKNLNICTN